MELREVKDALVDEAEAMLKLADDLKEGGGRPLTNFETELIKKVLHGRLQDALSEIGFMYLTGATTKDLVDRAQEAIPHFTEF